MKSIEHFMLPEQTNSLYEKEAISSIYLTKEVANKINELIDVYNTLSETDLEWKHEQEGIIRKGVIFMKDNLLNSLHDLMEIFKSSGFIDDRIEYHCNYLKERLDTLIKSDTVDGELIDIRTGYNGKSYKTAGESVRNQIAHIDEKKIDKTETLKANFQTENLLLEDWFKIGFYYSAEGVYGENANAGHYPLVEVEPETLYTYYGCQILVVFDDNMNVLFTDTELRESFKTLITPKNAKYISVSKGLKLSFKSGLYKGNYTGSVEKGQKMVGLSQVHGLETILMDLENSLKRKVGKNLFNKNSETIVIGHYVLYTDGSIGGNDSYSYDVILVEPKTTYTVNSNSNEHIAFFDENGKYISGTSTNINRTFTTPENVKYLTFSFRSANIDTLQIEKGSVSTTYENYEFGLSGEAINNGTIGYEKLSDSVKNAIGSAKKIVHIGAGYDYTNITEAIHNNPVNTIFMVHDGVYDLVTEYENFYGSTYFTNYEGYLTTGNTYDRGLNLGIGCELIGVGNVIIQFNYTGNNNIVKTYFAPLNLTSNNLVENITSIVTDGSCRYHIHDDFANESGKNIISNVCFYGKPSLNTGIGGGMGVSNNYEIKNCYFENAGDLSITYHNNVKAGVNNLIVKDCYCDGSIRATHYGVSTEKSKVMVSNCKAFNVYIAFGDQAIYPNENIELIAWNNEV